MKQGFTLIEISIVLVIIGFLTGGVLVGRDLVSAAEVRAQITQIESFHQATNTFKTKYNSSLPGDINAANATTFGFAARGSAAGQGDSNGVIEGNGGISACGQCSLRGETLMFWSDLTYANGKSVNLIPGSFSSASSTAYVNGGAAPLSGTQFALYLPKAKLGKENYIYAWSGGYGVNSNNINYFGLAQPYIWYASAINVFKSIRVIDAYNIDKKIDDGLPQTGNVLALADPQDWANGDNGPGDGTATPPTSTTCYDDRGQTGAVRQYSYTVTQGTGINCYLSFKFQ